MSQSHRSETANAKKSSRSSLRFWGRFVAVVLAVTLVVGGMVSYWAVWQSRQVPDFYKRAFNQSDQAMQVARNQLQFDVEQLQSDLSRRGSWNASFSEDEINAWLSDQLPERFDRLSKRGVREPAIAIEDGQILAAVRYQSSRWDTVVSCRLSVEMTEEPNLLAIHLSDLKAGALPLPLEPFVRRISREAALGDLDIRWDFTEDGPIALVHIPPEDPHYAFAPLVIELVSLTAGRLRLSGQAGQLAQDFYSPRGPLHRFVSFRKQTQPSNETENETTKSQSKPTDGRSASADVELEQSSDEELMTSDRGFDQRHADSGASGTKASGQRWMVRKPSHTTPAILRTRSDESLSQFQ
ncbi:hypothetical protein [Rhodopirellula europaea]|uniref:Putative secreted protein n=1 Tax=Rhodopirellula europaea SH398 TaxID=1263868 RepID=M5SAK3_9BACT|nr:hypothetical protein [Rhodopirellula europaea]EMI24692.1 putative secreted protein [Rhodopirellula europaea SH398]MCR9207019.1 hypothetical protein [bacterium]